MPAFDLETAFESSFLVDEELIDDGRDVGGHNFWYFGPWLIALCVAGSIAWFHSA